MVTRHYRQSSQKVVNETGEVAHQSARSGGGFVTLLVSAFALLFSGVSLYQTVIKQAQLHMFVPEAISYTRDPDGSFEVFAIPITITNSGARDGIVSAIKLEAHNLNTGVKKQLEASYLASTGYFSSKEDISKNIRRPKVPFAPMSVAGRSSVTQTILFYAREFKAEKVVPGKGRYELRLTAAAKPTEALGFIDKYWTTTIEPKTITFNLPQVSRFFQGRMLSGHTVRLFKEN